jgi:hypothetical protein
MIPIVFGISNETNELYNYSDFNEFDEVFVIFTNKKFVEPFQFLLDGGFKILILIPSQKGTHRFIVLHTSAHII